MGQQDYPVVDGYSPSWADVNVRALPDGAPIIDMSDIKEIKTGTSLEIGTQMGANGGRPMKRTRGAVKYEASWTLYYSGLYKLYRGLITLAEAQGFVRGNQVLVSLVQFPIHVQWTPPGSPDIFEFVIKGCRYAGRAINGSDGGTDAVAPEVSLNTIEIADIVDGKEIVLL